jgi:serine/threonine-protein kinase RsbW
MPLRPDQGPVRVAAEVANLKIIRDHVEAAAHAAAFPDVTVYDLVLAVDEAATNIIVHGYGGGTAAPGGETPPGAIEVDIRLDEPALIVTLRDQAQPFDPTATPIQAELPPLSERMPGGLGIFLMRKTMNELRYRRTPDGWNELTLVVLRPDRPQEG